MLNHVNKVWVITPLLDQRETLLKPFVAWLTARPAVQVLGCEKMASPFPFLRIKVSLKSVKIPPLEDAEKCFVEEAEVPVIMGDLRPNMRI